MLSNLAVLQWKSGQREAAVETLREALAAMEAAVGPDHPDVAKILDDYSAALEKTGRKAEAKTLAARAESIRTSFQAQSGLTVDWRDLKSNPPPRAVGSSDRPWPASSGSGAASGAAPRQ
jgi:hypothetical protein